MLRFLVASAVIFAVLVGWLYVDELYRRFTRANPGLGPFRPDNTACGGGCCACSKGSCGTPRHDS